MERVIASIYKNDEILAKDILVALHLDEFSQILPVWRGDFDSNVHFDMRGNPHRIEISDGRKGEVNISGHDIDSTDSYEFVAIEDIE